MSEPELLGDDERELPPRPPTQSLWRRLGGLLLAPIVYLLRRLGARPASTIDPDRDRLERKWIAHAAAYDLPVLGICRGAQLMNVCAGGSLCRDLAGFYGEEPQPWTVMPRKDVEVDPTSRLAQVMRMSTCRVNGLHRHAVEALGRDLRVVAREPSGLTQAIEHVTRRFWIGVQWHPEYLPQLPEQRRLFEALVAEAHHSRRGRRVRPNAFARPPAG